MSVTSIDQRPVTVPAAALPAWSEFIDSVAEAAQAGRAAGTGVHSAIALVRERRFGAYRVPRADHGAGATLREFFAQLIALSAADSDVAHILRAHFWFMEERLRSSNEAERARWVERAVRGDLIGNATSELSGAAVGSWMLNTTVTPSANGHVLKGEKYYCTGTLYTDWVNVYAAKPDGTVASLVIPTNRAGVQLHDDWDGIGQELSASGGASFHNVRIEPEDLLASAIEREGEVAAAALDPYLVGQFCQLYLTAVIAGILRSVLQDATAVVCARGRSYQHAAAASPSGDPLLQATVGEIASAAFTAESIVLAAAAAQDDALAALAARSGNVAELAHLGSLRAAQAKVAVDTLAQQAAAWLFDVGGSGAVRGTHQRLDRHWRNIRTLASHNPASYKARAVGDYFINGTSLPPNGFF